MPANILRIPVVWLVWCVSVLALSTGCSNSGSGNTQAPANNGATPRLTLSTTAGFTALIADGQSTVPLRLQITNAAGANMPNVAVTFATTAGVLSESPVVRSTTTAGSGVPSATPRAIVDGRVIMSTDANGVAQVLLTASTVAETAVVTADALGFRTNVTVDFVAGPPARVQLQSSAATVAAAGTANLTATVMDAQGNPRSGDTVLFTFTTNTSGASLTPTSGTTTTAGQVAVRYTAGQTGGIDTIRATVSGTSVAGSTSITVSGSTGGNAGIVRAVTAANGATSGVIADGKNTVAITATVEVVSGSRAGIGVVFTTTAGSFGSTGTSILAPTNATGVATVNLIAPTSLGTATVTAAVSGFSAQTAVTFVAGPAAVVQLTTASPSVVVSTNADITALVTDAQGNPIANETLTFAAPTRGILSLLTGVTDISGRLSVTYTAGTIPGAETLQARTVNSVVGTLALSITPVAGANNITLLVSSPQLDSSGAGSVTLTALVRDTANNVLSGIPVSFRADSGGLQVLNGTTGVTGTATALLTTGGDQQNRSINVTATTGNLSAQNTIQITGTTLSVSGVTSLILGRSSTLTILLRDSAGTGIGRQAVAVTSALGNLVSTPAPTDPLTGRTTVDVTARVSGTDTIRVTALGTSATASLSISGDNFALAAPMAEQQIPLNTPQDVILHWDKGPQNPQSNRAISFFATRGNFVQAGQPCPASPVQVPTPFIVAPTDPQGNVTVRICADNAGPAIISATADVTVGPSAQVGVSFVSTIVASVIVQATPTTLGVNVSGGTTQQSNITAVLRDTQGNLVANQPVSFSLTDVSGGQIAPSSAISDSFGKANTVYFAGSAPSAKDGVLITAASNGIRDTVALTVTQQSLFVTLGTGNLLAAPSSTQYSQPYSVLVNDANGNPVAGATVALNVIPTRYQKGRYILALFTSATSNVLTCRGWVKFPTVQGNVSSDDPDQACDNEDSLVAGGVLNGILDPGEDRNNNGRLDPGNVAATPKTVTTDASGFALFEVVYAKEFTWVEVELEARAFVAGSEGTSRARFFLNGLVTDFDDCTVAPPGLFSPYGQATTCSCDERTSPTGCQAGLQPVTVTLVNTTPPLPSRGGTFTFTASGGTQSGYDLTTSVGVVNPQQVVAGQPFGVTIPTNTTGIPVFITVSATDLTERQLQTGTLTLTQTAPVTLVLTIPIPANIVPVTGGVFSLTVGGGTQTSYDVVTTLGTLSAQNVVFAQGRTFTVTIPANTTGTIRSITISATDTVTSDITSLTLNQAN